MERTAHYEQYLQILREELIPAMGCTEPVAIALAAAKAREALGAVPERCRVEVSGNIIKNVKAVTVPNTGGLKGIEAAAAAGMAAGRPELELEVLSRITQEEIPSIHAMLDQCAIRVVPSTGDRVFFINVTVAAGSTPPAVRSWTFTPTSSGFRRTSRSSSGAAAPAAGRSRRTAPF